MAQLKCADLKRAWDDAVVALRAALVIADDFQPCAEQSRLRAALTALGETADGTYVDWDEVEVYDSRKLSSMIEDDEPLRPIGPCEDVDPNCPVCRMIEDACDAQDEIGLAELDG